MSDSPLTIYDLAKSAGVSYATVSRVLNDTGRTSASTREKVLAAAAMHNFRPKMKAHRTTVALLMDVRLGLHEIYFPQLLTSLVARLCEHNLAVEIFSEANLDRFKECYADAVIAVPRSQRLARLLTSIERVPAITLNHSPLPGCTNVASDHYAAGHMAADYLIAQGHRRAAIFVPGLDHGNQQRVAGFNARFEEAGIDRPIALRNNVGEGSLPNFLNQVLAAAPTALFLSTEDRSQELLSLLRMLNVRVPEDLSIIAMENELASRHTTPPLTTIDQRLSAVVDHAIDRLLEYLHSGKPLEPEILTENCLIERQSVRRLTPPNSMESP